jgi:hypothetical protein
MERGEIRGRDREVVRENVPVTERREVPVVREVRTEPVVRISTVERDEDRERRKDKGRKGLLLAAAIVLASSLLTFGTTWHFATKAKEGVQKGIEGVENIASKGKEALFGKPYQSHFDTLGTPGLFDRAKATLGFGRHEALQKVRDALGVESGKPIGPEDYSRLEELIRLDQYSHSEGFWENLKKLGPQEDVAQKLKAAFGFDKAKMSGQDKLADLLRKLGPEKDATQKLREALGLDSDKSLGHDAVLKLKEMLGVDANKPIGEDTFEKLKEVLGYETHEPGFWEKAKSKLHMGTSEQSQPDIFQQLKHAVGADKTTEMQGESLMEKVKDTVGLGSKDKTEKYIEEAKHKAAESQEYLNKAYAERKKERTVGH